MSAPGSPEARAAWGFDQSDLPPHPGVRFGVLPNGMRYALMRNAVPAGALSVRLHVAVGAKMERAGERGFAHLVEHLLFHGTRNIPEGSLPLMLAHRGMRHWSDINAVTSYDDTVYRLDMTRADPAAREAALLVMSEVADKLLFTPRAVSGAKGDVAREIAARDAVADAVATAENQFLAPGTPIARGTVLGTAREVRRARAEAMNAFYQRFYVPERATLIMVGDFDPDEAEREIAARFANWQRGGPSATEPPPPVAKRRGTEARLFIRRGAPTAVTIAAATPLGEGRDVGRRRDTHFLERLGSAMLARRLRRLADAGGPFAGTEVAIYDHFSTVRLARIDLEASARDWWRALVAGAGALRDALTDGFNEAELADALAGMRSSLIRNAAPSTTAALADAIADAVGRGIVFTAPADPSGTDAYLARIRLADVNSAFRSAWAGGGRLIFVSHDRAVSGGEQEILKAWSHSIAASMGRTP